MWTLTSPASLDGFLIRRRHLRLTLRTVHDGKTMRTSTWYAAEDSRIRSHLVGALEMLRAADTATLEAPGREARARNIAELERYVDRGRYPRNSSSEGPRLPALVDTWGTRCALAHLIESSGSGRLLDRLRRLGNHAWVRELAGDAGLVDWLRTAGLSANEAARIQPSYRPYPTAFECACNGLWSGGAIGRLKSASAPTEVPRMCRVVVEEILTPRPTPESGLTVGAEIDAVCPARPLGGARVLLGYEVSEEPSTEFGPRTRIRGMVARSLVSEAVVFPATCTNGSAYNGKRHPSASISLSRMREAMKGESAACTAVLQGIPYEPPKKSSDHEVRPSYPRPKPSEQPTPPPPPEKVGAPVQVVDKPMPPIDSPFPQPVHYVGSAGALLFAGTAAYFFVRRRA